jgi:hypothetical protein
LVTELSLTKPRFDEGQFGLQGTTQHDEVGEACYILQNSAVFCHVAQYVAKTPSALFGIISPKLVGHLYLNYKAFSVESN